MTVDPRAERIRKRRLGVTPHRPTKLVIVHTCFSQAEGESKNECSCSERVTEREAYRRVSTEEADWLIVNRNGTSYANHSAIVIRQSRKEINDRRLSEKEKRTQQETVARFVRTHLKWASSAVRNGRFPPMVLMTEAELIEAIAEPEQFRSDHPDWPEDYLRRLEKDAFDIKLSFEKMSMSRGRFMSDAPHGKGELVLSAQIEKIGAHKNDGTRRVKSANFKPDVLDYAVEGGKKKKCIIYGRNHGDPNVDFEVSSEQGAAYIAGRIESQASANQQAVNDEMQEHEKSWQRKLGKENL